MRRLSSADVTELRAADELGLLPESVLRREPERQDMQATYEAHRAAYGTDGNSGR